MAQKVRTCVSIQFKVFEQITNVVCIKHMDTNLDLQSDKIPNKNNNLESNHGLSESTEAVRGRTKKRGRNAHLRLSKQECLISC